MIRKHVLIKFIDYKKAYINMIREEHWKHLEKKRVSADLLRKEKNAYENTINCIKKIWDGHHGVR
jgi:hypothetical protein